MLRKFCWYVKCVSVAQHTRLCSSISVSYSNGLWFCFSFEFLFCCCSPSNIYSIHTFTGCIRYLLSSWMWNARNIYDLHTALYHLARGMHWNNASNMQNIPIYLSIYLSLFIYKYVRQIWIMSTRSCHSAYIAIIFIV